MSSTCNVATNTTFIDLATFSEVEAFLYGGADAVSLFVGAVQKANWFSHIPITLRQQGTFDFGQRNVSACLNRSGDYILQVWFRVQIPQVTLPSAGVNADSSIAWTRNLMHNLIEKVSVTHNELTVHEFDEFWLDMRYQFWLRGSKRVGYRNIIGDIAAMTTPVVAGGTLGTGGFFSVPLPFWFGEDSGVALPIAALPFNEVRVNYCFRTLAEVLTLDLGTGGAPPSLSSVTIAGSTAAPAFQQPETYAEYVVVHNDERVKMGDAPRDIAIYQNQTPSATPVQGTLSEQAFDLRLSHSVISMFWAYRNTAIAGQRSNYTTLPDYAGLDPISFTRLQYESQDRLAMGSDYYSLIHPYLFSKAIPEETGYHMWSYALLPWAPLEPSGSTNFSKLANTRLLHTLSPAGANAVNGLQADGATSILVNNGTAAVQTNMSFEHKVVVKNWNIVRVANGSLGLPSL